MDFCKLIENVKIVEEDEEEAEESINNDEKCLTEEEKMKLEEQNKRLIPEHKVKLLEKNAQRYWDLFYKRNETRFFKDRRWTTREFIDLLSKNPNDERIKLLEVGCGVGNFIFPLIEDNHNDFFYYACDFSPRAIQFIKNHPLYDESKIEAFQCDITSDTIHERINEESIDIVTMIFVLSAIHPQKFDKVLQNLWTILKDDGIILFRDYGLYDMAQFRFKPGHKISDNFYMRQDGTCSYYFSKNEIHEMFTRNGFAIVNNMYVNRRTVNLKEKIDVSRTFIQAKFKKIKKQS